MSNPTGDISDAQFLTVAEVAAIVAACPRIDALVNCAGMIQRCGKESSGHLMQRKADGNQPNSGNASNSRSKTIKAIQPVDGIGDPYQPNHSGQQAEAVGQSNRTG